MKVKIESIVTTTYLILFLAFSNALADNVYLLNPGDRLMISVWNEESLQREVLVLPDGSISFPLVGTIQVVPRTPEQVKTELLKKLSRVIPDPEIDVSVTALHGNNVYVLGQVNKPGQLPLIRPTDVLQALSLAGGLTAYAKGDEIKIIRRTGDGQQVMRFDYTQLAEGKALKTNILLKSGDTIIVP